MYKKSLLSSAIMLALVPSAYADDYASFDEVVVSTTRLNTQITDTAASVTVINASDIEQQMAEDIEGLFKYTPGVTLTTNSRQGVQGINIRGIEGNRIKVIVDGVAQPNQFDSGNSFLNSSRVDIDTDMVKSVEIVKGAASSLQGSDAIGGIVAFETKDPADILKGRNMGGYAKLNYSSSDKTFSESIALANKSGDLESLVAYTRRDGQEIQNFGSPDQQDNNANNLLVKLQYQLNPKHRLEFSGNYIRNKNDLENLEFSGYKNASGTDETTQYQLGIKHIWDAEFSLADRITWQFDVLGKEETGITDRTSKSNGNIQKKDYLYSDKGFSFDSQLDKSFMFSNTEHYIVYGFSLSDKDIENTNQEFNSIGKNNVIFYMPNASEKRYGFFIQDEIAFDNLIVTPGIRFDSFETKPGDTSANPSLNDASEYKKYSDSALTARLGTVYKLNQENRLFAQISQGFRAPDFQELYYSFGNPAHGYVFKPNPNLEAEDSVSYELGWRYNADSVSNELSIFYSDYDNFIDSQIVSGSFKTRDAVHQSINIDKATIKGIELSNQFSWDRFMPIVGFSSRIAAAYTEGKDGNGKPLNSVSPWNAVTGINYDSENNWGTAVNLTYTAKKKASEINGDYQPISSATVIDVTAYYKPIKDLTLRAGVFNLTDEEYYNWNDVRGLPSEDKDKTQAKRNFGITAKYEF
ncbi:TonB-dependent hemoglobin/transferrin/lactoferrin family receptor [Vibrio cholerae]|uniref:TonB-dependent hemoglobin/transferrin/lactoferrin family receptor n=2 Tax=Vibrio cholerae TaxID=666 RepID=A0A6B3LD95_VIBCL|nr:TonB-dependent hemoglobin/transferrin/lactoferrin family receptor [Vibrio cholerae]EHQ2335654.1 TonB-dependent hemoglobin/transferrin/lactoferrin family receptor [Vibrio cholerae]EJL6593194.1 TonB-dependent hemoglobin/transferrin/lactoferrin family receptor [Vibrio cholerae]EJO4032560.1 TonB-dependent hemoglobin/transferrin/lactoferrin family receptor [Vibrio cholerae]NEM93055.1 TonB-dependent hemoglobin/transferrin/lactoferrin family receptor [Vibrio cholerae]GIB19849.1 heme transport prot